MTDKNANESLPGQPAGQPSAGDGGQQAEEPRRKPEEGAPAAPVPGARAVPWATYDPKHRRRQDREAGPSDKQVYVPPVTLPPNREHQIVNMQKIQVAPAVLKGVDERSRPTMRKLPPVRLGSASQARPVVSSVDVVTGPRPAAGPTTRIEVGPAVLPPPEAEPAPLPVRDVPAQSPRVAPAGASVAPADTAAVASASNPERGDWMPLVRLAVIVFLGSSAAVGVWLLWQRSLVQEQPAEETSARLQAASSGPPAPSGPPAVVTQRQAPSPASSSEVSPPASSSEVSPPASSSEVSPPASSSAAPAQPAPSASSASANAAELAASAAELAASAAARSDGKGTRGRIARPPRRPSAPEDPYSGFLTKPSPSPAPPSESPPVTAAPAPTTTAPPRPF
jgi:cytoskeletal protein RodZ